jgi:hypothetical protein
MAIENGVQDWDRIVVSAEEPKSIEGIGDEGATVMPQGAQMPTEQIPMQQMPAEQAQINEEIY